MKKKRVCLLGATGSIGFSSLDILEDHKETFDFVACSCYKNCLALEKILKRFPHVEAIYISSEFVDSWKAKHPHIRFFTEKDGFENFLKNISVDLIINALVGFVGLEPTVYALENNMDVALANKESLVAGGELINDLLRRNPSLHLYPLDSEHVALAKCLAHKKREDVERLILTASGGAFRNLTREELKKVTLKQALNHPSWKMGPKITIDSATMVNKAFEIIEAYHLFSINEEKIDVLLHDESYVHSLIEMIDGSYVADIGPHDMRIPISFALFEQNYKRTSVEKLRLEDIGTLHFRTLDCERFPAIKMARRALHEKGTLACAMNAANDVANSAFREGKLPFDQIEHVIEQVMDSHRILDHPTLEDLIYVNKICRKQAEDIIKEGK